jgi:uncharacterized caspase-like protein
LALLLSLLLLPAALAEKRVALVVGIDKYDNLGPQAQLRRARSDAAAVARLLKDIGFDVMAMDDVTRSAFNSHWQDFLNKLTPGDTAAFYFAGHGVEFAGRNYLLPRDVPHLKPGRDELLRREALSLQEFLTDLREKGTRLNLVILDACRENPFEQVAGRSLGSWRGLAVTEPPEGTFIMYSAGAGETALDQLSNADRDPNSVYTRHLLPLLKTQGMSLTEVAEQVRVQVRQTAATVQHRQTPAYYNQVLGQVCLAGGECGTRLAGREAAEAWDRTKDTTSLAALEAFIRRFSDTYYGDLARVRLAELVQAEVARKKAETEAQTKEKAERQRLAILKEEQDRERAEAVVKKRADDARAEAEAERQRIVLLQQEQERKRAEADSAKQAAEAAKRTEEEARAKRAAEHKRLGAVSDGQYKGLLDCSQLPWTKGPLRNEPVALTISAGKVKYSRAVHDRNSYSNVIGREVGGGSVDAAGTIALIGSFQYPDTSIKARYHGKFSGGVAKLAGKQIHKFQGQAAVRTCSMTISR